MKNPNIYLHFLVSLILIIMKKVLTNLDFMVILKKINEKITNFFAKVFAKRKNDP